MTPTAHQPLTLLSAMRHSLEDKRAAYVWASTSLPATFDAGSMHRGV